MEKKPVLILHGWSDNSNSFLPLSNFLKDNGFKVVDIWLADYLSMRDEITIYDLGQAMGKAINDNGIPQTPRCFDVVVHSTGGLVVRQYLIHYFFGKPEQCPIHRLVMLAPANFGSPLASKGQSVLGRFLKGWKWDGMFQTGTQILNALKLASPITCRMAELDLFSPKNKIFSPDNIYATILIGSDAYDDKMKSVLHENGSDGTVRVSTANLNASYIRMAFKDEHSQPDVEIVPPQYDPIAFGVLYNYNHSTITMPEEGGLTNRDSVGYWIIKSLTISNNNEYQDHLNSLNEVTRQTFERGLIANTERYHQYQNLVTYAHDQFLDEISDYCIEFYQKSRYKNDRVMEKMHKEVLEKVEKYSSTSGFTSFLFDITDLYAEIINKNHKVEMSVSAVALSRHIKYLDPHTSVTVVGSDINDQHLVRPNSTLLVDIQLPKIQSADVFKLKKS